jgi:hypothetical protein
MQNSLFLLIVLVVLKCDSGRNDAKNMQDQETQLSLGDPRMLETFQCRELGLQAGTLFGNGILTCEAKGR